MRVTALSVELNFGSFSPFTLHASPGKDIGLSNTPGLVDFGTFLDKLLNKTKFIKVMK